MRIAITGATGFIGSHLTATLKREGHVVIPVSRKATTDGIQWDPARGVLDPAALEGVDAVIHLAGEGIADKRWTEARKQAILESRTRPTDLLARTLASLREPPGVLISMSAVGIYGDSGDRLVTEDAPVGDDFLARVCRAWEAAAEPAHAAGIRVVHPRMGVVLSRDGGALTRMLLPFRLGLGGRLGHGEQWMSWIAIDDAVTGLDHCLKDGELHGPVNLTAPVPVTNREFTSTLARALRRPAVIPVPALALRVLFGEVAEATLLTGQRATPGRLQQSGYQFTYGSLGAALQHVIDDE
jgi:uncharacterized protein (TIGR01777 family)